jgi:hypothetical protein
MSYMNPVVYAPDASQAPLRRANSMPLRKRSMAPGGFHTRKSDSDKDAPGSLAPVGVVFMEQIALDIDVLREPHAEVKYVMTVRHLKTNATWRHERVFDDYRRFQQRLLRVLDHGHFCHGECPWLYTFLKSYFPKKHLFQFVTSRVVASRTDALRRFFVSLQGFLLNRANHNCSIVASHVVDAVVDFVYGEYAKHDQLDDKDSDNQRGSSFSLKGPPRGPESPDDDDMSTASGSSSCGVAAPPSSICLLCESSLEGEAYAASRSGVSTITNSALTSTASSTSLRSDESFIDASDLMATVFMPAPTSGSSAPATTSRRGTHYVMKLGCGHQFHDECIVPKLNETLRCPTCGHLEVK